MRITALCWAAALVWATLAAAQVDPKTQRPQQPPTSGPGTLVAPGRTHVNVSGSAFQGELAPDFELDGSLGKPVKLSRLRGDWVVLVFAERVAHLQGLSAVAQDLRMIGGVFLGVCDEKSRTVEQAQERTPMPFAVAADPTGEVSALYGLYDHLHTTTTPGFFVIDRRGIVRLSVLGQQLPAEEILGLAKLTVNSNPTAAR
jgi:peroxiredoxin